MKSLLTTRAKSLLATGVSFWFLATGGQARADFALFESHLNLDGSLYSPGGLPPVVNAAGFDFTQGLGSIVVQFQGAGDHFVGLFTDHEIDETVNTFFNEFGLTSGSVSPGLTWEIDEPGYVFGDIYDHLAASDATGSQLDNSNGVPQSAPDDVSMALGWNFTLGADERGTIRFDVTSTAPTSGFYLEQRDPDSNKSLYFTSSLGIQPIQQGVPDVGSTWALLLGSLAVLGIFHRARRPAPVRNWMLAAGCGLLSLAGTHLWAAPPVVKTVPWAANKPLVPHDSWSGKEITLKGTSDVEGGDYQYIWDFGDGSAPAMGTVADQYVVEARHTYTGSVGTVYTATLTVRNTATDETANAPYYVMLRDVSTPDAALLVQVNVAIDEGLWYLHKDMRRYTSGGVDYGDWWGSRGYGGYAALGFSSLSAANLNAFEVNGHLESGPSSDPYTETTKRAMKFLFTYLTAIGIPDSQTTGLGSFNPDTDGNGLGIIAADGYSYYQGGMLMDTIIASGTPDAVTTTGPANIVGRTYKEIVRDMVDAYAWAQYDGWQGGGWRYNANEAPDNSACQWAAIGMIAAERVWGCVLPAIVKDWNKVWLAYSQSSNGSFGYTDPNPVWGPYATTPSGLVQMALDGIGRDDTTAPSWNKAESFMRDNFAACCGPSVSVKDYYYGMFSFVKSMLLHNHSGNPAPIVLLQSTTPGVLPIDWYAAQVARGDSTDGVARTLVDNQNAAGYWYGHNQSGNQYPFETAQAIMMLHCTLFESGAPVAVAQAVPNPAVAGQLIQLSGAGSYHQDATKIIDSWDWDLDNNGTFETSGPWPTVAFPAVGTYTIKLRVSDNGTPEKFATTIINILVSTPPLAPTANAGLSYSFCPASTPWFLDGRNSRNPDEGEHEPGKPGDTIVSYAWDLDGNGVFDDAAGATPDVTAYFMGKGPGSYLIQLKVTDRTATSFPSSLLGDLWDTDSAVVVVRDAGDPECTCISDLAARVKSGKVQLTWTPAAAHHYNVYRGTTSGGPYQKIGATSSTYSTYLDSTAVNGTTYFYVVREANLVDDELCQSNQTQATPRSR